MLDLDRHVVADPRKFAVKRLHKLHRVPDPIEKVRIAKRNMLRPRRHLLANVRKHHLAAHNSKHAFVHRHDRTVPAKMFAPAAGLRRSHHAIAVARNHQMRIFLQPRHPRSIRHLKRQPIQRYHGSICPAPERDVPAAKPLRQPHQPTLKLPAQESSPPPASANTPHSSAHKARNNTNAPQGSAPAAKESTAPPAA